MFVEPGEVRNVGADENNVTAVEPPDVVADEMCAAALFEVDQFNYIVVMPAVINVRNEIPSHTERLCNSRRYFS